MDIKKPYKLGDREYRVRYLHIFKVIQQLYGTIPLVLRTAVSVRCSLFTEIWSYSTNVRFGNIGTLCHVTVWIELDTTTSRGFLSILTVDFPSLLRSLVNLTFGSIHMVRLRRVTLCPLRLPYLLPHCGFPCSASQLGKSYVRKKAMQ